MDERFYSCNGDPDAIRGHWYVNIAPPGQRIVWVCKHCDRTPQ